MPGSLITTLLSLVASHLVLLTFAVFIVVGSWLFADRGMPPNPQVHYQAPPPDQAPVPEKPPMGFRPDGDPEPAPLPSDAPPDPAGRTTQGAPVGERQPQLIGGTLPNYASASASAFRPPVAGDTWSLPPAPDRAAMVQTARRAFWNGDLEAAEAAYIEAIARYPVDPDLFGELGNLYVSMGRRQRALDAFYESALRLRATGESEKLSEVIDLLESHGYPQEVQSGAQTGR
jgi:hypothetical protein